MKTALDELDLEYWELRHLFIAAGERARREAKNLLHKPFTPPAGQVDVRVRRLGYLESGRAKLMAEMERRWPGRFKKDSDMHAGAARAREKLREGVAEHTA